MLSVPDGRSVTTLVNATPIPAADGAIDSVIVTLQDLAPLEELERQRTQFLGIVSHELLAPLTSIKGSAATALGASPGLKPPETRQFFRIIDEQADHMRSLIGDLLDAGRIETGTLSVDPEPSEVAGLVDQARNTFLSGGGRHAVRRTFDFLGAAGNGLDFGLRSDVSWARLRTQPGRRGNHRRAPG